MLWRGLEELPVSLSPELPPPIGQLLQILLNRTLQCTALGSSSGVSTLPTCHFDCINLLDMIQKREYIHTLTGAQKLCPESRSPWQCGCCGACSCAIQSAHAARSAWRRYRRALRNAAPRLVQCEGRGVCDGASETVHSHVSTAGPSSVERHDAHQTQILIWGPGVGSCCHSRTLAGGQLTGPARGKGALLGAVSQPANFG